MRTIFEKMLRRLFSVFGYRISLINKNEISFWPIQRGYPYTFYQQDSDFHDLYNLAQDQTGMWNSDNPVRRMRHYTLIQFLKNVNIDEGCVCEVGTFRGLSAYQIASFLTTHRSRFLIFDSFEGLSKINQLDKPLFKNQIDEEVRKRFACSLDTVKNNLKQFHFIEYFAGWVPERFQEVEQCNFSFVHIDVDLYQPTLDCISFFYPRVVKNGLMVFDDYGAADFPGAKQAIDEYLSRVKIKYFFGSLPSGQAFLLKLS